MSSLSYFKDTLKKLKIIDDNKNIKNIKNWINKYINSFSFIKVLTEWKKNPPSKKILDNFKYILNTSTCHSYPSIYLIIINHNVLRDYKYKEIFDLIIYFGFDIRNLYFKKYTIIDLLILHSIYINEVINLLKSDISIEKNFKDFVRYPNLILKEINKDTNFFDTNYYDDYAYINELEYDYNCYMDETYYNRNISSFYRADEINRLYDNGIIYYTLDSLDKLLSSWQPSNEDINNLFIKINMIDIYSHPQILFSLIIDFENKERNFRIIKNLKKLGYNFNTIYEFSYQYFRGDTIENYIYYKERLEEIIEVFIVGLANQIIFRNVKHALNDKYILSKLRYNIEKTRYIEDTKEI